MKEIVKDNAKIVGKTAASIVKEFSKEVLANVPYVNAIINSLSEVYHTCKNLKLNSFLYSLAKSIESNSQIVDYDSLVKMLSNGSNIIGDIIDSVLISRSEKTQFILGIIAGNYYYHDTFDYEDLTLIGAIRNLLDEDLNKFAELYETIEKYGRDSTSYTPNEINPSTSDYVCIEKLVSAGLFGSKSYKPLTFADEKVNGITLVITPVSTRLKTYLDYLNGENFTADLFK